MAMLQPTPQCLTGLESNCASVLHWLTLYPDFSTIQTHGGVLTRSIYQNNKQHFSIKDLKYVIRKARFEILPRKMQKLVLSMMHWCINSFMGFFFFFEFPIQKKYFLFNAENKYNVLSWIRNAKYLVRKLFLLDLHATSHSVISIFFPTMHQTFKLKK